MLLISRCPVMKPTRILVAEDEALVAMDIAMTLEEAGFEVVGPARSLDEAITAIGRDRIDAAVLDVDLEGEQVYPVARLLHEKGVPVLFHTGHANASDIAMHVPTFTLCPKPCDPRRLLSVLQARF